MVYQNPVVYATPFLASPLVAASVALVLKLGPIAVVISAIMNYPTLSTISAGCPKYFFGCDVFAGNVAMLVENRCRKSVKNAVNRLPNSPK